MSLPARRAPGTAAARRTRLAASAGSGRSAQQGDAAPRAWAARTACRSAQRATRSARVWEVAGRPSRSFVDTSIHAAAAGYSLVKREEGWHAPFTAALSGSGAEGDGGGMTLPCVHSMAACYLLAQQQTVRCGTVPSRQKQHMLAAVGQEGAAEQSRGPPPHAATRRAT